LNSVFVEKTMRQLVGELAAALLRGSEERSRWHSRQLWVRMKQQAAGV
jgi:Arc/MetJ family transcription regulator